MPTWGSCRSAVGLWFLLGAAGVQAQPANDDCANATLITSLPFADGVDTTGGTTEPSDPLVGCDTFLGSTADWRVHCGVDGRGIPRR